MNNNSKKTVKNITQMSKFEATMFACQRAKAQALKESAVKKPTKKSGNKSAIKTQNRKVENALRRRRVVEDEEYDPEVDDDLPEDTVDDAVIVVDPELDTDEYEANLDDLQAIIDETPDGEVPSTDEYVNDFVYTCPICGNNFFSDTEMSGGEACPVCGEEVDEFILVGDIQSPDEALGGSEGDEELDDLGDEDIEDVTEEENIEEPEDMEEELEVDAGEGETEEDCCNEDFMNDADLTDEGDALESKRRAKKESYKYLIDEKTLNPFLTKFIKENYKNATSMRAIGARILGRTIKIECQIKFKSGSTKKTVISLEGFVPSAKKRSFKAKADSAFKVESKKSAPFTFEAFTRSNIIKFTGMNYSFITKKEGKRVQIYGKYALKESFRKGMRK